MIVQWTNDNAKVIPRLDGNLAIVGNVVLAPGFNDVPDVEWMEARDTAKRDIDTGRITEEWVKAEKVKGSAEPLLSREVDGVVMVPAVLKDINRPRVIDLVKNTYHVPTLNKWIDEELRQDVRREIMRRLDEITKKVRD